MLIELESVPPSPSLYGVVNVHINSLTSHRSRPPVEDNIVKVSGKRGTLFSGKHVIPILLIYLFTYSCI